MNEKINSKINVLPPFKRLCMTIGELPASYLETMSYYETLLWLIKYLQETVIPTINNNAEAVSELQELFLKLQDYVNHYFDSLNIQNEINNKLDQMYEDGTLQDSILKYIFTTKIYNTALEMIADIDNIVIGQRVMTLGYNEINDGGNATYIITDTEDPDEFQLPINENTYGNVVIFDDKINVKQLGVVGDGITDHSEIINKILSVKKDDFIKIEFNEDEVYLLQQEILLYSNTHINLNNGTIKSCYNGNSESEYVVYGNGLRLMNNYASIKKEGGYGALENVIIENGELNGDTSGIGIFLFHGLNLKFRNLHFVNCLVGTHVFDMGGCKDVEFLNCDFIGNMVTVSENYYRETIQLDYARRSSVPYWGDNEDYKFDNLPCENINVFNCSFKKGEGTYYPSAIGTHTSANYSHKNINIENCEFHGTSFASIRLPRFQNVTINNNTFYNYEDSNSERYGIFIREFNAGDYDPIQTKNINITNNKFLNISGHGQVGIYIRGHNENLYVTNVLIKNNIFDNETGGTLNSDVIWCGFATEIIFSENLVKYRKNIFLKINGTKIDRITFNDNNFYYCTAFVTALGNDSDENCTGITINESNNIWTNDKGTLNINNFHEEITMSAPYTHSGTTRYVKIPYDTNDNPFFQITANNENYNVTLPFYVNRVKVKIIVLCDSEASTDATKTIRTIGIDNNESNYKILDGSRVYIPRYNKSSIMTVGGVYKKNNIKQAYIRIGAQASLADTDVLNEKFGTMYISKLIIEGF